MLSFALDEKTRRLWAASEATTVGWGGVSIVSEATGLAHTTIRRGVRDLKSVVTSSDRINSDNRIRRVGAGRKSVVKTHPQICEAL